MNHYPPILTPTIQRLARQCELQGIDVTQQPIGASLYHTLKQLHPDYVDVNNSVLAELHRRKALAPSDHPS